MMKQRIFVSVPMTGMPESSIRLWLKEARTKFLVTWPGELEDIEFYDNYTGCQDIRFDDYSTKHGYLKYLAKAISELADCDAAIFAGPWTRARGCMVERIICSLYGIKTYDFMIFNEMKGENNNGKEN